MPEKENNILKYNCGEKLMKVPFVIYADTEYLRENLLEKVDICYNNPKNDPQQK